MTPVPPYIPETAPFSAEQRAWLNGFMAGLFSVGPGSLSPAPQSNGALSQAGTPLLVLFGSQTGAAEGLAKKFAKESAQRGFAPLLHPLNDFEIASFAAARKAVIISSTWGDGDPPDNAVKFWNWLKADTAPRLEHLEFAVLGLGDKNYSDFCGASKKFDARLEALGAKRLLPRAECDTDYEAPAEKWLERLWETFGNAAQAPRLANSGPLSVADGHSALNGAGGPSAPLYSRTHPFPARLLKNLPLNRDGSSKEVRHYEIALGGSGLAYEAGDALGIMPKNCAELVAEVLRALNATGDEPVALDNNIVPLRQALAENFDITRPSQELLAEIARRAEPAAPATEPAKELAELAALLTPGREDDLKKWLHGRDVLDLLLLAPAPLAAADLLPLLRKLSPRLYSISSSPHAHPGEVHLTVGAVRYEAHRRARKGVASTFLADRAGDIVKVFVSPSHGFRPPASGDAPMIMVGPGTGIAPFRAFLEDRAASGAKGKNWLFFGDQKRAADFLYEDQLLSWQESGFLTRLDLAFSRDQAEKIYVQDRMLQNGGELWSWLEAGAHFYICGDASRMAKDVDAALHKIIETAGAKTPDEAKAYVEKMKSEKRYQRDVY